MIRSTQQTLSRTFGMIGLYLFLGPVLSGFSMTMNLAMPWSDRCSPPQSPYLVFDSPQSDDLLFDTGDQLELRCQAGLRSVALRWTLQYRGGRSESTRPTRRICAATSGSFFPTRRACTTRRASTTSTNGPGW